MAADFNKISVYISAPRLQKYQAVCSTNQQALKLYQTNLRLSQAFYSLLSLVEVIIRNALNEELTRHFQDPDWLRNQRDKFMSDPRLTYQDKNTHKPKTNSFLKTEVDKSIQTIRRDHCKVTQSKIIAVLKLGFWLALFDKTHYAILGGAPIRIFKKLPPGTNRISVDETLTRIRSFRNRVYHNEPIIFKKNANGHPHFDLGEANAVYSGIQTLFSWLDLDYNSWTKRIDNIDFEMKRADCVFLNYPSKKYYYFRLKLAIKHYKRRYFQH